MGSPVAGGPVRPGAPRLAGVVVLYAVALVLLVYCFVDLLRTPAAQVRTLPKPLWALVLLAPLLGPLAWLLTGRATGPARPTRAPGTGAPDDDDDFLRELRRRAADLRRRARDPRDDDQP